MPLQIQCPCGKRLQVPDTAAGKRVKCPACQTVLAIEAPPPVVEEDEFEVVEEEPRPKAKPAAKKPMKAVMADADDEEEDEKPRTRPKTSSVLKGLKNSAVSTLGGSVEDDEDQDEDDEPRPKKKKKGSKSKKKRASLKSEDDEDESSAFWKSPQGMILNGLGLIGLGIGGIVFYFVEDPRPIGLLVAGILCIGFGIGGIITGLTKKGQAGDDD